MAGTQILCADLAEVSQDARELQGHVGDLDDSLNSAISLLQNVKDVSDTLSRLDDNLGVISVVMTALKPVPYAGTAVGAVKPAVDTMKKGVHPVRTKANALEKKVKPVREKLQKVENQVAKAKAKLGDLRNQATAFKTKLEEVYDCNKKRSALTFLKAEDKFCDEMDPSIRLLDKALDRANQLADNIDDRIKKVKDACQALIDVKKPLDEVDDVLKNMSKVLDPIKSALNKSIDVPYSVKVKVKVTKKKWWKVLTFWDWKWESTTFSFTIQQIIDGIDTGIGFVNDKLMDLAKAALKKLNVNFPKLPEIPGLSQLEDKLEDVLGFIGQLEKDLDKLESNVSIIFEFVEEFKKSIDKFNITC